MVFKRRNRLSWGAWARALVYPRGGFRRATHYLLHRMRRLPDKPHTIARGVFAGTFISVLPILGGQFLGAWLLALALRGNVLAALLATFLSNPVTTPFIAIVSIALGQWLLGVKEPFSSEMVASATSSAVAEIWHNIKAVFTDAPMRWDQLQDFWHTLYWPYLLGSVLPGLIAAIVLYYLTIPLVHAYQKARSLRLRERREKRRTAQAIQRASGGDDGPGPA